MLSREIDQKWQTLALSVGPISHETLINMKFKAFWGLGKTSFWTLKDKK
jgi:hypothetical protein